MIKVIVEYKGSITKKYFKSGDDKVFKKIYILITDKRNLYNHNYHFICDLKTGGVSIPSTSLVPKESSIIYINFKNNTDTKTFRIPIHSIYSLGQDLPTTLRLSIDFNV